MTDQVEQPPKSDERKAFEQWWATVPIHRPLAYLDAWAAWHARAALSAKPHPAEQPLTGQVLSMAAMMEKALEILKNVEAEGGHDEEGLPDLIEKAEAEIAKVLKDCALEVPSHG